MALKEYKGGKIRTERSSEEIKKMLQDDYASLSPEEKETLDLLMQEMSDPAFVLPAGSTSEPPIKIYDALALAEYKHRPVDIETFVKDEYYLGNTCSSLFPRLLEDLKELFSGGYSELIACVHPDTPIPLLDGSIKTMFDLVKQWEDNPEPFWVYGVEPNGKVIPVLAEHPRQTGIDDYYKVTLDDGTHFICNARHQMMMRTGEKRMVQDMSIGDSIMPFTTKLSEKTKGRRIKGYEMVLDLVDEKFLYTHALVAEETYGKNECVKRVIHHKDFNKLNNEPNNLQLMKWNDHQELHSKNRKEFLAANPEVLEDLAERGKRTATDPNSEFRLGHKEFMNSPEGKALSRVNLAKAETNREEKLRRLDKATYERWQGEGSDEQRQKASLKMKQRNESGLASRASKARWAKMSEEDIRIHSEKTAERNKARSRSDITIEKIETAITGGAVTYLAIAIALGCSKTKVRTTIEKSGRLHDIFLKTKNHCVVSIENIGRGPVYCMTVPRTTNFAICTRDEGGGFTRSGVFSSNTGAIGTGKTFMCSIAICRILYEISCLKNPQKSFGLAPGSPIAFAVFSVTETLAMKVAFDNIATKIEASPYFRENFPFNQTKRDLEFAHDVQVSARAANMGAALGLNAIGFFIDEGNFMKTANKATGAIKTDIESSGGDTAQIIYDQMFRRMKSRYQRKGGKLPGMAIIASSKRTRDDFTAKRVKDADDSSGIYVVDYCLTGDTKIALMDGTNPTIKELAERYDGSDERFWVYSYSKDEARIVPGRAYRPRLTKSLTEVYEIELDNGEKIKATSNHPFMLRDGTYCRVEDLSIGMSLMPLYRRHNKWGYEEIGQPNWQGRWQKTHHMAAVDTYGTWPKTGPDGLPMVVHHKNVVKTDNRPENLQVMSWTEHKDWHNANMTALINYVKTDEHRSYASQHMTGLHKDPLFAAERDKRGAEHFKKLWQDPDFITTQAATASRSMKSYWSNMTDEEKSRVQIGNNNIRWDARRKVTTEKIINGLDRGLSRDQLAAELGCSESAIRKHLKVNNLPSWIALSTDRKRAPNNHKVINIRILDDRQDVYDLSVEDYSNFCLTAGIVVHNSVWEVHPEDRYSKEKFHVLVGNESILSKILEPEEVEEALELEKTTDIVVLEVPEDFRPDFVRDLENSARDIGGVATVSISPFIHRRETLIECYSHPGEPKREHPFTTTEFDQTGTGQFIWSKLAKFGKIKDGTNTYEGWQPLRYPDLPRYIHIDPSINSDATGMAMGCVTGFKEVQRRNQETQELYTEYAPEIWVDYMLRIIPPSGGEIDFGGIRQLIYELQKHGFHIGRVTMDQFQSVDTMQKLKRQGILAEYLSVDRPMDPYDNLKAAFYENRINYYEYQPVLEELRALQHDKDKNKVDHPKKMGGGKGKKDVADALCGIVYKLSTEYEGPVTPISKGISEYVEQEHEENRALTDPEDDWIFPVMG